MTTQRRPRIKQVTAEKCADWGYEAMGRQADQATAQYDPMGGTATEACANCLFFMSPDDCTVVQDYPYPISPTGHSKFWTPMPAPGQAEPVQVVIVGGDSGDSGMDMGDMGKALADLAQKAGARNSMADQRMVQSIHDGAVNLGADCPMPAKGLKAVWSTAYENNLPDSSFAVISAGGTKDEEGKTTPRSLRHLPYKDADGKVDMAHLRNALSRLPQTDLTASERAEAQRKLDAAAKAEGIGAAAEGKSLLDRIVAAVKGVLLPSPDAGTELSASAAGDFGSLAPAAESAFRVYKEAGNGGDYRWVALVSNKYRDRDNKQGPEIIAEAAHKEYVAYLDRTGDYPEAWLWHTPGTAWGKADWADYADGFLLMSGTVNKGMEDVAAALSQETLGVSHGFFQRYSDAEKGIIGWYRTFEVSALPPEAAANPWTALAVIQKEAGMPITAAKRQFIESKLGKDRVSALEGDVAALAKALQDAGVEYKDLLGADGAAAAEVTPPTLSAKDIADAVTKALEPTQAAVAAIKAASDATAGALPGILERLKALEKSDDEKIAAAFTAKATGATRPGGFRATADKSTEVTDGDELEGKKPEVPASQKDWLEKALAF